MSYMSSNRSLLPVVLLLASIGVSACSQERNRAVPPPIEKPTRDYLEVLERVRAQKSTSEHLQAIRDAIERFQLELGRTPNDLTELVELGFLETLPTPPENRVYRFDPRTGTIRLIRKGTELLGPPRR